MARAPRSRPAPPRGAAAIPAAAAPPPAWASLAAGAAFLAVYLAWSPGVPGDKDSGEFTLALATMGLPHPTGYALYTLLGHGFVVALHALGVSWARAANAWSAAGGAVAVALLHAFSARLLVREGVTSRSATLLALLPAAAFGLNPGWTSETTLAEVNSWHLAWVAAALLAAERAFAALAAPSRDVTRSALVWSLLVGAGLAHHATSVLVALPLTLALLVAARPLEPALLPAALAGLVLPLAGFGYVAWRGLHPVPGQWEALAPGVAAAWAHVTGAGYRHYLGGFAPSPIEWTHLAHWVLPWLVPAALLSCAWPLLPARTPRALRVALAAAVLLQLAYTFAYGVADPLSYFLPALAIALAALPAAPAAWTPVRRAAPLLATVAACGIAVAAWSWNGVARERQRGYEDFDRLLRSMWAAVPLQRGWVVWDDDMHFRLVAYQRLEGLHPDLVVVHPKLLAGGDARALFALRHGVDPLAGEPPTAGSATLADRVAEGLNRAGPDSVVVFMPEGPSLRLLTKPARGPASAW